MLKATMPPRPTTLAQVLLSERIEKGDRVIDATAGNGYDTVFLADAVGQAGRVLAFDVQSAAIASAEERVKNAGFSDRVEFFQKSHTTLAEHAEPGTISAVMFNLGYLPGEDHGVVTKSSETIVALDAAAGLIRDGGVLSIVCYSGHPGGDDEAGAVEKWMTLLASRGWRVAKYGALGTKRPAPFLLIAAKG
jgi:tRNA A58 N-methylase Trm61